MCYPFLGTHHIHRRHILHNAHGICFFGLYFSRNTHHTTRQLVVSCVWCLGIYTHPRTPYNTPPHQPTHPPHTTTSTHPPTTHHHINSATHNPQSHPPTHPQHNTTFQMLTNALRGPTPARRTPRKYASTTQAHLRASAKTGLRGMLRGFARLV